MSFNSTFSALSTRGFGVNLPQGWLQQAILVGNDSAINDEFGYSVAMNQDGTYLVVGARSAGTPQTTGAAYVFTRSGTTWTQQAKLSASDGVNNDFFGSSVSINDAGDTIAVGAPSESTSPTTQNGAVYIFTRSGTTWTQQTKLLASDKGNDDNFGNSISLDSSGNYLIVGASNDDISPNTNCGSAYVFNRSGTTWTQQTKIIAPTRANDAFFGYSVQFSKNSNYIIIGAQGFITSGIEGRIYVYIRSGSTYSLQFQTSGSGLSSVGGERGRAVTINTDGSKLVFSSGTGPLSLWFFNRTGTTWTETQLLQNIAGASSTNLVNSSGLSTNNTGIETMLGLYAGTSPLNNKVYNILYNTNYYVAQLIVGSNLIAGDVYGFSVSIASSINYAAIGAPASSSAGTGRVYIIYKSA